VTPADEVLALWETYSGVVVDRMESLARSLAAQDALREHQAMVALADAVAGSMAYADLRGRRRVLMESDAMRDDGSLDLSSRIIFTAGEILTFQDVPRVPFWDAIRSLLKREPRLAKTAEDVAAHYQAGGKGFAAAYAATVNVARRVRDAITSLMERGATLPKAADVVAETAGWTKAYAETVYQTNVATAYSEGRREQAKDPEVRAVVGAFRISATNDSDVRRGRPVDHGENHLAAHGLTCATTDPIWSYASTPYGYRCRCVQMLVSRAKLKRDGLLRENGEVIRYHPKGLDWFMANFSPHPLFGSKNV